jgi:hypothetical protein
MRSFDGPGPKAVRLASNLAPFGLPTASGPTSCAAAESSLGAPKPGLLQLFAPLGQQW